MRAVPLPPTPYLGASRDGERGEEADRIANMNEEK